MTLARVSPQPFDLYYWDGLARQTALIKLTVNPSPSPPMDEDAARSSDCPPVDLCIRCVRWRRVCALLHAVRAVRAQNALAGRDSGLEWSRGVAVGLYTWMRANKIFVGALDDVGSLNIFFGVSGSRARVERLTAIPLKQQQNKTLPTTTKMHDGPHFSRSSRALKHTLPNVKRLPVTVVTQTHTRLSITRTHKIHTWHPTGWKHTQTTSYGPPLRQALPHVVPPAPIPCCSLPMSQWQRLTCRRDGDRRHLTRLRRDGRHQQAPTPRDLS